MENKDKNEKDFKMNKKRFPLALDTEAVFEDVEEIRLKGPSGWGTRHTIALMTFFGSVVSYALRINLSMAIVDMVKSGSKKNDSAICPDLYTESTGNEHAGEFEWSTTEQGFLLGSFFWGYVATQVPGGIFSEKYGAKWVFGIGILLASVFCLLTPVAARLGLPYLVAVRVVQGLGEGVTPPATHALLAQWSPPLERSKMGSFVYAGNQLGTMTAMLLSGGIISSNFLGGWQGVFYTFGVIGIVWFGFWTFFVSSRPEEHPKISQAELSYIKGSLGDQTTKEKVPTPWGDMKRSMPFWAIMFAQLGNGWGLYTLLTFLPKYMNDVLLFDIKQNSLLSAMPYFCMFLFAIVISPIGDILRVKRIMSTTGVRKLFNTIGHWGPAVALVGAAFSGCSRELNVTLLTIAVALSGAVGAAYQVNHIDIAPNHAGVLMGVCNGVANLAGIAAPYAAGSIIDDGKLMSWRLVFFISAGVYFCDNLFYLIFATGREQYWNRPKTIKTESQIK